MNNTKQFKDITERMLEIYIAKNNDYGNSFDKTMDKFGPVVGVIRLGDKYNRLESLIASKEMLVKDESIEDTLLDLANYAIMTYMWYTRNKTKNNTL